MNTIEKPEIDTVLNNLYFGAYQKSHTQFFKDISNFEIKERLKVCEYLLSEKNQYHSLLIECIKKDKNGDVVNSFYNGEPLVLHFCREEKELEVIQLVSHSKFNVSSLENQEYLKLFVKSTKKNEKILLTLIENKPDLTLIKNLKNFNLSEKIQSVIESIYLNNTISNVATKKNTFKI